MHACWPFLSVCCCCCCCCCIDTVWRSRATVVTLWLWPEQKWKKLTEWHNKELLSESKSYFAKHLVGNSRLIQHIYTLSIYLFHWSSFSKVEQQVGLSLGLSLLTILLCFTLKLFAKQPRSHRSLFFFWDFSFSFWSAPIPHLSQISYWLVFLLELFLKKKYVFKHIFLAAMLSREFQYVSWKLTQILGRLQRDSNWTCKTYFHMFSSLSFQLSMIQKFKSVTTGLILWSFAVDLLRRHLRRP